MRVRGAAGLLLAPILWVVATAVSRLPVLSDSRLGSGSSVSDAWHYLLWTRSTDNLDRLSALARDGALLVIVVIALFGIAGKGRFLVALAALYQIVCFAPWVYYDTVSFSRDRFPPRWAFRIPWYQAPSAVAAMWVLLMLLVLLMALTAGKHPSASAVAPGQPYPVAAPPVAWQQPYPGAASTEVNPAAYGVAPQPAPTYQPMHAAQPAPSAPPSTAPAQPASAPPGPQGEPADRPDSDRTEVVERSTPAAGFGPRPDPGTPPTSSEPPS